MECLPGGEINVFLFLLALVVMCWGQGTVGEGRASLFKLCKKTKTKKQLALYQWGKAGPLLDSWELGGRPRLA